MTDLLKYHVEYTDNEAYQRSKKLLEMPLAAQKFHHSLGRGGSYAVKEFKEFEDKFIFIVKVISMHFSHKNGFYTKSSVRIGVTFEKSGRSTARLRLWKNTTLNDLYTILNEVGRFIELDKGGITLLHQIAENDVYRSLVTKGSLSAILSGKYKSMGDIPRHYLRYSVPELKIKPENWSKFMAFLMDCGKSKWKAVEFLRTSVYPNEFLENYEHGQMKVLSTKISPFVPTPLVLSMDIKINWIDKEVGDIEAFQDKFKALESIMKFWSNGIFKEPLITKTSWL